MALDEKHVGAIRSELGIRTVNVGTTVHAHKYTVSGTRAAKHLDSAPRINFECVYHVARASSTPSSGVVCNIHSV